MPEHIIHGDPEGKWDLPAQLLSDDHLAASQLLQDELAKRVNSPFAAKSTKDLEMFRSGVLIKELEPLAQANVISDTDREYLAEAYASIGEYAKASQTTLNEQERARWQAIWDAVWRDDEEKCGCSDIEAGKGRTNNQVIEENVYSLKHLQMMPVVKCRTCEHRNATQLPARIANEKALRRTALTAVSGMKPEDAKNALLAIGHTSKFIVK